MLKNGQMPASIAILHCIGSRDTNYNEYCSRVCCMYSMKIAHLAHEKTGARVYEFYIDIRAFGKGYEEFYKRMLKEETIFIRGKAAEVTDVAQTPTERGKLVVVAEDTLLGAVRRIPVDMVVLSVGLEARKDAAEVARTFSISRSQDGFFLERHPKLAPVSTASDGIFIAGACQSPKDIPDSVAQGAAAAANVLSLIDRKEVTLEPTVAFIDEESCSGCKICIGLCPYNAITFDETKKVSLVNDALCKGCGACVAACPSGAITQRNFTDKQLLAEVEAICASKK
jgi:heterodisulfide reductase subunit A